MRVKCSRVRHDPYDRHRRGAPSKHPDPSHHTFRLTIGDGIHEGSFRVVQTTHGWGFVSHAEMACAAIRPDLPVGPCTCGELGMEDRFIGADAPDGFTFAAMDGAWCE